MPKNSDEISLSELARRLNISPSAVTKALKSKRITRLPNGKVNYAIAVAQWKANSEPSKRKVKFAEDKPSAKLKVSKLDAAALSDIKRLLNAEGFDTSSGLTHELVRTAEGLARAHERMFKLAIQRKEYVPLQPVQEHTYNIFVGFRKAIESIPARTADTIAAKLGCDAFLLEQEMLKAIKETLNELAAPVVKG